jgi:hypothetical protein
MFDENPERPDFFREEEIHERLSRHCDTERYARRGRRIVTVDNLRGFFENQINVALLERGIPDFEYFLCSSYVAEFLSHAKTLFDSSWYAVDQQLEIAEKKGGPHLWEKGGKNCFIVAVFFPGIHPKTGFGPEHYIDMASRFFYMFYGVSGLEIGNHMANLCEEMVDITKEAIET